MQLSPGDPFPHLTGLTPTDYMRLDYLPGRYIVLAYLPASSQPVEIRRVMAELARNEAVFDDNHICFFGVLGHTQLIASAANSPPGIRWFLDPDGELFRESGMSNGHGDESGWIVLDPALRVMKTAPLSQSGEIMRWISDLPSVDDHCGARIHAPVLIVPRVLEPELCAEIVAMYRNGQAVEGPIRSSTDDGDVSELYVDRDYRATKQVRVDDPDLKRRIDERLRRRLAPEMFRALRYQVGAIEGHLAVGYDAAERGRFRVHRDNPWPMHHRQFTFAINLNEEEYEGGNLRFPEYGTATYRPPTGGAIVFASSLLHEVTLLSRGRRYVLVAWFVDTDAAEEGSEDRMSASEALEGAYG
jgi:predicted 2-oxoglutarate/Fe(II)-dependent dioxygenase YbiX